MEYTYNGGMEMPVSPEVKPAENFVLGLVGALIGAALGGASIIGLGQLGYIASISGVILAFCTLKGYELLAKGISTKGVIVCAVLMLVTPFLADYLNLGITLYKELSPLGATFGDCMEILPEVLKDSEVKGEYLKNLGMLYLFVVLGGFYIVKNAFKK